MKLYHTTDYENKESIEGIGICPTDCGSKIVDTSVETLQDSGLTGIYGWKTLTDAIAFGQENGYITVVFEFDAADDDLIDDPEFSGEAMFLKTSEPVSATVVYDYYDR